MLMDLTQDIALLYDGKYGVCHDGSIISFVGKPKKLVGRMGNAGYRFVVLTVNGKKLYPNVHRLVAKSFVPNPNMYTEVNHIDGNKLNNDASNLEWVTSSQNKIHARDMNLCKSIKYNMSLANLIRADHGTNRALAKKYNMSKSNIQAILKKEIWV